MSSQRRKIRMLILSDTHGGELKDVSLPKADVVLHCGDLTRHSRSEDFERTLAMLRIIDAPLKLAIPGNHDYSLEPDYWRWTRDRIHPAQQQQQQHDHSGAHVPSQTSKTEDDDGNDARVSWELFCHAAQRNNIFLLPQGTHTFVLPLDGGGARLRIFASPLTPRLGNWGFQYDRSNPHKWIIPPMTPSGDESVDVVMTHGPPRGIRDHTGITKKGGVMSGAGCAGLLAAVERAKPRIHCFGHIHEAWGAELITWKRKMNGVGAGKASSPTLVNLVDAQQSRVIATLPLASKTESASGREQILPKKEADCFAIDISPDGEHPVERGAQTLFVNAAVELPRRIPWLVTVDLPVADEDDAAAAAKTMSHML